jgi:DNA-binding YbaB/EbfC family protein
MLEGLDLSKLGSIATEAQNQMNKLQEDASRKTFSAKSGGGMVSVSVSGKLEVTDISFDDSLLEDKETLQILLIGALNEALKMAQDDQKNAMFSSLAGLGGALFQGR